MKEEEVAGLSPIILLPGGSFIR